MTATHVPAPLAPLAPKYRRAAQFVAEDLLSDREIAVECGIDRKTLYLWRDREDFMAAVDEMRRIYAEQIMSDGLARREIRVRNKVDRHRRLMQEVSLRGKSFRLAAKAADGNGATNEATPTGLGFAGASGIVPQAKAGKGRPARKAESPEHHGQAQTFDLPTPMMGDSGFLTRTLKMIGAGDNAQVVEEFEIDVATSRELSRLEEEVAVETGQRIERHQHEVRGVVFVATRAIVAGVDMSPAAGRQRAKQLREAHRVTAGKLE
jgi:hypothetical protein